MLPQPRDGGFVDGCIQLHHLPFQIQVSRKKVQPSRTPLNKTASSRPTSKGIWLYVRCGGNLSPKSTSVHELPSHRYSSSNCGKQWLPEYINTFAIAASLI